MHISKVEINGFLSFNNFEVELTDKENIIVGANGTGKSNFLKLINILISDDKYIRRYMNDISSDKKYMRLHIENLDTKILKILFFIKVIMNRYLEFIKYPLADIKNEIESVFKLVQKVKIFDDGIIIEYIKKERRIKFNTCTCTGNLNYHYHSDSFCFSDKKYFNMSTLESGDDIEIKKRSIIEIINDLISSDDFMELIDILKNTYDFRFDFVKIESIGEIFMDVSVFSAFQLEKYIDYVIKKDIMFVELNNYVQQSNITKLICKYDNALTKFPRIGLESTIHIRKSISEFMIELRGDTREKLFSIKNDDIAQYKIIIDVFEKITGKRFDISYDDGDYWYRIIKSHKSYNCSRGEEELIDFLTSYYYENVKIMLFDEPCSHLSTQNKMKFRDIFLTEDANKQRIMVTHDVELIDVQKQNILYFKFENESTFVSYTKNFTVAEKKL